MNAKSYFCNDRLVSWSYYYKLFVDPFLIKKNYLSDQNVDLRFCVGTRHPSYINKTWSDLYGGGLKRLRGNLAELKANPNYYLNSERKDQFSFYKFEKKYL